MYSTYFSYHLQLAFQSNYVIVLYIVSEIKQNIGQKSIFHAHVLFAPVFGWLYCNFTNIYDASPVSRHYNQRTDRQMHRPRGRNIYRAMHMRYVRVAR